MANTLNDKDFGLKMYNRFPPKYREDDVSQKYALKRYLEALADGGFSPTITDINGITTLIDAERVDSKVLPILLRQFGFETFNGIPENYLRYLLPKLGEAWSKKGSLDVVEFITSALSGVKVTTNTTIDEDGFTPIIEVKLEMDYNIGEYFPEVEQFNRILEKFLPFYSKKSLVYSYMFYEDLRLITREWLEDLIIETKDEVGGLQHLAIQSEDSTLNDPEKVLNGDLVLNEVPVYIEVDQHKDSVTFILNEKAGLDIEFTPLIGVLNNDNFNTNDKRILNYFVRVDEFFDIFKPVPVLEEQKVILSEYLTNCVKNVYNENVSIWSKGKKIEYNALLGEAIMGESIIFNFLSF